MPVLKNKSKRNELRHNLYEKLGSEGESLPNVVKDLRRMLGKDQVEFSKFVGISVSALRRIEQESGNVTLATVMKILNRFSMVLTVKVKQ